MNKKLLSVLLALIMVLSLSTNVMAAAYVNSIDELRWLLDEGMLEEDEIVVEIWGRDANYELLVIPEGVTVTFKGGNYFNEETISNYGTIIIEETVLYNYGVIINEGTIEITESGAFYSEDGVLEGDGQIIYAAAAPNTIYGYFVLDETELYTDDIVSLYIYISGDVSLQQLDIWFSTYFYYYPGYWDSNYPLEYIGSKQGELGEINFRAEALSANLAYSLYNPDGLDITEEPKLALIHQFRVRDDVVFDDYTKFDINRPWFYGIGTNNNGFSTFIYDVDYFMTLTLINKCKHQGEIYETVTQEPTCEGIGLKDIYCADCDELLEADVEIPALGHDYVRGGFVFGANMAKGAWTYVCSRCGDEYTADVELTAFVVKLTGNQNMLIITVTEEQESETVINTEEFLIDNNSEGIYAVDGYKAYIDTKGNTQIRACYFTE